MNIRATVSNFLSRSKTGSRSQRVYNSLDGLLFRGGNKRFVDAESAMELSAVWRCIQLISSTMASLPLNVYRYNSTGRKDIDHSHELSRLFHYRPNDWQTPMEFWEMMWGHKELRGNAYAQIIMDNGGRIQQLIPLHPDRVFARRTILTDSGQPRLYYQYFPTDGSPQQILLQDEVFHLKGLSFDGITGISPVRYGATMMGSALAAEDHTSQFFENATRPSGYIKHPGKFKTDEDLNKFKKAWQTQFGGAANSGKTPILTDGMEWQQIGFSSVDAELLANRKFSVSDVCRWFGVPPYLIFDLEKATFNNSEQQGIDYVKHAIAPRCVRVEQVITRDLMTEASVKTHYVKHKVQALLRGDQKSRYESYAIARQWGWMCADDIADLEDANPLPNGQGQIYLVPLNMIPSDQVNQPPAKRSSTLKSRFEVTHLQLLIDSTVRAIRKEATAARRTISSARSAGSASPLKTWASEFYGSHQLTVRDAIRSLVPVVVTGLEAATDEELDSEVRTKITNDTLDFFAITYMQRSRDALFSSLGTGITPNWRAADQWLTDWETNGAAQLAAESLQFIMSAVDAATTSAVGQTAPTGG